MKLVIQETIGQIAEVKVLTTILKISPFDAAADAVMKSTYEGKGDLIAGTGNGTYVRVPPPTGDGKVLKSDSLAAAGVSWGDAGGNTAVSLTNRTGGSVDQGDVLVFENGYDNSFTTTNSPNDLRVLGVAAETIDDLAAGLVNCIAGSVVSVKCDTGAVNRGEFLVSGSSVKLAKSAGYFMTPGAFAIAMSGKAAGSAGSVQAMIVHGFRQAVGGGSGWVLGGNPSSTTAQKLQIAVGTWSVIAGAALPVGKTYRPLGFGNNTIAGYTTGGLSFTTCYKITYATETNSAVAGLNTTETKNQNLNSGLNSAAAGYRAGGDTSSVYTTRVEKNLFSTETISILNSLSATPAAYLAYASDGTYGYALYASSNRITFGTDTVAANTAANLAISDAANINFPALAAYIVISTASRKLLFSSGTPSVLGSSPAGDHDKGVAVGNGISIAFFSGGDASPYQVSDKFTLSTETYASDGSSALPIGEYNSAYFNNGAL